MKYSVIIPVYNSEKTLGRCLDSILNQAFSDYEILLINDGSADCSDEICREYAKAHPQIRYFAKENGGVSSARNLGLNEAKGEYILFADSDDYVSSDYFEVINKSVDEVCPDLLLFGYRNFGGVESAWDTGVFYESTESGVARRVSQVMRQYLLSSLLSKVFRRDIIESNRLRFDGDLAIAEDLAFIFAYAMHIRSMASIEDRLYNVDVGNSNSLSRKARPYLTEHLMQANRCMYEAYRAVDHSPEAADAYESALAWMTYRSAYSSAKEFLKFGLSAKQRRKKIRELCRMYRRENIKPIGWKCRIIALPVQLGMTWAIDWLVRKRAG